MQRLEQRVNGARPGLETAPLNPFSCLPSSFLIGRLETDESGSTSLFFHNTWVGEPDEPMLEAYTTLGFSLRPPTRVELEARVTGVTIADPAGW
jgi:hypothetical protein